MHAIPLSEGPPSWQSGSLRLSKAESKKFAGADWHCFGFGGPLLHLILVQYRHRGCLSYRSILRTAVEAEILKAWLTQTATFRNGTRELQQMQAYCCCSRKHPSRCVSRFLPENLSLLAASSLYFPTDVPCRASVPARSVSFAF